HPVVNDLYPKKNKIGRINLLCERHVFACAILIPKFQNFLFLLPNRINRVSLIFTNLFIELTDQTRQLVHLEGCHVVSRRAYRRIVFERRLMLISVLCCSLAVIFFVVAVGTISWAFVEVIQPNNASFVLQLGVWATWIRHFPRPPEDRPRLKDQDLPHYHRAQAALSSMAIGLMILSIYVAVCSLKYHRYMYKRLAAGVMFLSAMCILATIQILIYSIEEWSAYSDDHKSVDYVGATTYGVSTTLAYVAAVTFFVSSVIFLIGGRKHKGLMAATQEFEVEDRPVNLSKQDRPCMQVKRKVAVRLNTDTKTSMLTFPH
uniref:Uncharacterized protein n=1 Tax=Romanomermis culicivorax TaxID=13658 RepID=A0A915J953_ROMCU